MSRLPSQIRKGVALLAAVLCARAGAQVDLGLFTPSPTILGYSVYVTDSALMPNAGNSGLATGGNFGAGKYASFGQQIQLRSPYITVGGNLDIGNNPSRIPTLNVGGTLTLGGSNNQFDSTIQVGQNLSAPGNITVFHGKVFVKGNFSATGNNDTIYKPVLVGGTYTVQPPTIGMIAATGSSVASGATLPSPLPYGSPLVLPADTLPGSNMALVTGYNRPGSGLKDIVIGTNGVSTGTDTLQYLSGQTGSTIQKPQIWHCSVDAASMGLPASACHGDTLQPGYYGKLSIAINRVVLIGEGFYSFDSIYINSQSAIMAGQPTGGRTVLQAVNGINGETSGSSQFIGPAQARGANGLTDFAGGTMMVISTNGGISMGSDQRIWATLSAPHGTLQFNSQVLLFGQAFGKNLKASNNLDFGAGAFIAFRGLVPTLNLGNFTVQEKTDPACVDAGGACRDTVLTVRMPYTTAYTVRFRWRIIATTPVSATPGRDFLVASGWDTIPARSLTATIKVRIYDDSAYELPEKFLVVLDSAYAAGFPGATGALDTTLKFQNDTGTIVDNDLPPRIRIVRDSARGILEGNSGTTAETFTVSLLNPYTGAVLNTRNAPQVPIPFWWSTKDGTATVADSDYVAVKSKADTIAANTLSKRVTVLVKGDLRYENDEWFLAALDSFHVATAGNPIQDTGWIRNDDTMPRVSVGDASVLEPATFGGVSYLKFPVSVSQASGLPIVFRWRTVDGTAHGTASFPSPMGDFRTTTARDTLAHDVVTDTLRVAVYGDTLYEGPETLQVVLDSLVGANFADSVGIGRIVDADTMPPIFVDDASLTEPSTGSAPMSFHVHLARPSGLASSFSWKTLAGTAKPGSDYTGVDSAFVVLRAGQTDTFLPVQILSDSLAGEGTETFRLALWNLSGVSPGRDTATGSILEAHPALRLRLDSVGRVVEADTTVHFHLSLDWYPADTVRVYFRTLSLGAHSPEQYTDTSGVLLLLPGKRFDSVAVRLHADTVWEPDLSFELKLDSVVTGIGHTNDSIGLATILDNGPVPTIRYISPDTSVWESKIGTWPVRLELSRPAGIPLQALVPVLAATNVHGRTWSRTGLSGDTLSIPARTRDVSFGITVVNDTIEQPDGVVSTGLRPLTPLGLGIDSLFNLTIIDDDHRPVVVITKPVDSLRTNTPGQRVCWTVDGKDMGCIDTTLPSGWSHPERCSTNIFGLTGCDEISVWVDITPPAIHVFKIVGPNPHAPSSDTTWWGNRARTRFGVDTVWYWVRDSIENSDGKSWRVLVDTLKVVTNFTGDGVFPKPVSYCDSVGNCAYDTGWIDLKQSKPAVSILTPPEGAAVNVGTFGVTWIAVDAGKTYNFADQHQTEQPGVDTVQRCWTDDVGNTGCDVHHVLAQPIETISGFYLDTDGDGRIDALVVNLGSKWTLPTRPTFDATLDTAKRSGLAPDSLVPFYSGSSRGVKQTVLGKTYWLATGAYLYDSVGGKILRDAAGHPLTSILGDTVVDSTGKAKRDSLGRLLYQVPGPGQVDSTRLLVRVRPPYAFGITGFPPQIGHIRELWSSSLGNVVFLDTFPIADSVPPVISEATVHRVENYKDPDTVLITASEPIVVNGKSWLEVGICSNDSATCPDSLLVWHAVPADSVEKVSSTTWKFLVQPGTSGSVRPGYKVRFLSGVSDSLGNTTDTARTHWATKVVGPDRPALVEIYQPPFIPYIPLSEQKTQRPGGILLQATNGNGDSLQWWDPKRGYLQDNDAEVTSECASRSFCNGPSVYINYPVRMVLYIYDHAGVFVISRTVEITQADIDAMKGDKIDRLRVSLQWNHRTVQGEVVATGVYHWRVLSFSTLPGQDTPSINNRLFNVGVKVQTPN
jgi:hypothetical protein